MARSAKIIELPRKEPSPFLGLLTPEEVAEELKVGRDLVLRLIAEGQIPTVSFGVKIVSVIPASLQKWLEELEAEQRAGGGKP